MTQSPNSNPNNEERESQNRKPKWKRRILLGTGCVLLLGIGGGLGYGWYFVQFQLASLVEEQLNQNVFAKRKLKIGKVTSFSPNRLTFGESEIVQDEKYLTYATVESVRVAYNVDPLKLLLQRTLKLDLDITLVDPNLHLEQIEENGNYIWDLSVLQLQQAKPPEGFITYEINLEEITAENTDIELVGKTLTGETKTPVRGNVDSAVVNSGDSAYLTNAKSIEFQAEGGKLESGGTLQAEGNFFIPEERIQVEIVAEEVQANILNRILELPFQLEEGLIGTEGFELISTKGVVDSLNGVGTIENVTMSLAQLPQPFSQGNGAIEFRGNRVELLGVTGFFGTIPAEANGTLNIPLDPNEQNSSDTGYNIRATTEPITIMQVLDAFNLPRLPVSVSGKVQADIEVIGEIEQPEVIVNAENVGLIAIDRVNFDFVNADIEVRDGFLYLTQLDATPLVGGTVTGTAQTQLEGRNPFQVQLRAENVPGNAIASQYTANLPIDLGLINATTNISGAFADNRAVVDANIAVAGGNINVNNFQVRQNDWGGNIQVSNFGVANGFGNLGNFNALFNISGNDYYFQPNSITIDTNFATFDLTNGGQIIAERLEFVRGNWAASLRGEGLQIQGINGLETARGRLNLTGTINSWDASALNARGNGEVFLGIGRLRIEDLVVNDGNFVTTISADRLDLNRFNFNTQFGEILRGQLNGRVTLSGDLSNLSPQTVTANGELNFTRGIAIIRDNLNVVFNWNGTRLAIERAVARNFNASGFVNLDIARSAIGNFYFDINARELDLEPLPNLFPGRYSNLPVTGELDFNGIVSGTLTAPQIDARLALRDFSTCSLVLEENLTGTLKVTPQKAVNLQLTGNEDRILVNLGPDYRPDRLQVNLNDIRIQGQRNREIFTVEVAQFPINIIKDFAPFAGINIPPALISQRLLGELSGTFGLNLNTFEFYGENIAIESPAVATLSGNRIPALSFDRITASFDYSQGEFTLTEGTIARRETRYILENTLVATRGDRAIRTNLTVQQGKIENLIALLPILSSYDETQAIGTAADLYEDRSTIPQSNFDRAIAPAFCVPYSPDPCPEEIQPEIPTNPPVFDVGLPKASILDQLRRLAEIQELLARQLANQQTAVLPPLDELRGTFNGTLTVEGSLGGRLQIDRSEFDFIGENWQWGSGNNTKTIDISQLILKGNVLDNVLTILPLEIKYQEGTIALTSSIDFSSPDTALETISGQLTIDNLSVAAIEEIINIPQAIRIDGLLNATVNIGGSIDNPIAKGSLNVVEASINQTPVQTLEGTFDYNNNRNARLIFAINSILTESAEPLTITGSIPYKLPFASVQPENQQLTVEIDVKNKGLILLNILTNGQVAWIDGQGEAKLNISANLDPKEFNIGQLVAEGNIDIVNGTIEAPTLIPEAPLQEINSTIVFDFDRIQVQNFQGQLASGGIVEAAGILPLRDPNITTDRPLTVQLEQLSLKFQQLYEGSADGEVILTGSLFEPIIGGDITLSGGRVELAQTGGNTNQTENAENNGGQAFPIEFDNLKLNLVDNVRIVFSPAVGDIVIAALPLLNFTATGNLTINGSLDRLAPEGTISLNRGTVNLFTTQFRLVRSYDNIAQFSPDRGLDPFLDVRMRTSVLETSRIAVPNDIFSSNEIADESFQFARVETIRVQAQVKGFASEISESVQLSSSPPRSDTEIVNLLGGSFVNSFSGGGDPTVGLINIAGSAFFGTFQNTIAEALGLSELRIYPTQIIGEEEEDNRDVPIDLAIEAAIDITDNISLSVLNIITAPEERFRFGIRYRVNRNLLLRGSTDLSGDNRIRFEYEIRF